MVGSICNRQWRAWARAAFGFGCWAGACLCRRPLALAVLCTLLTGSRQATSQAAIEPLADGAAPAGSASRSAKEGRRLAWRGTRLVWAQSATTQTLGVGHDPQTRNPTHEMSYLLRPRYSVYVDRVQAASLAAECGVARELTNSDLTTRRGQWSLTDAMLYGSYGRLLQVSGRKGEAPVLPDEAMSTSTREYISAVGLQLPVLTFPTSWVSWHNGTRLGLGWLAALQQSFPLSGLGSRLLPAAEVGLAVGYTHLFTVATEPTSAEVARTRMDPDGALVVSDQLDGAAFARHQVTLAVTATVFWSHRIAWTNRMGWRPSYRYRFSQPQQVCGVVSTGCVTVDSVQDPQACSVVTHFSSEVGVRPWRQLGLSVGYSNVTLQLRPDGRRRNVLYSPDARFQLAVTFHLDELYTTFAGRGAGASAAAVQAGLR
jgi:hypothetical protein